MEIEEHGTCVATYNAGDFSYFYHAYSLCYDEANEHCKLHGGNLAVLQDVETIVNIVEGISIYINECKRSRDYLSIGLHKNKNGIIEWADGSQFEDDKSFLKSLRTLTCSPSDSYTLHYSQTNLNDYNFGCINDNARLPYICQKPNELPQTTTSTTSPQTTTSTTSPQTTTSKTSTKHMQKNFTTQTQEVSTTSYSAIIGVVSALFACLVIVLVVVAFVKYRNKRKADTKKQSSRKNLNRTNELSNNALVESVNMLPYPSDTGYASIEYQKMETPSQAIMKSILPDKTSVYNYNLSTDTEDSFSESVTDFHETPTANYASVDFEKKQPKLEFPMLKTETAKEPQSQTYAVVNKLKTKKTSETDRKNNVNEEDEEDTAYSNFTSDDLYSRLKI